MNKSLFRRPGTKHFQLVHRSQRDPLIHDPTASDHVLKLVDGPQQSKSKYHGAQPSRDQEEQEDEEAGEGTLAAQLGDAAAYGVYFDDHEYDYMQHLRPVGAGGSSFLVETPSSSSGPGVKGKGKAKARPTDFSMKDDMPEDALPSHPLDELSYTDITSAQAPTGGLQPDLDPSVREVLEALDDDAYAVDDGLGSDGEDEFWGSIVKSGERGEHEKVDWVTEEEEGVEKSGAAKEEWAQVAKFKKDAIREAKEDDEDGSEREWGSDEEIDSGDDTIAELVKSSARRPPRKPSASQSGSQFSMTSSAMFRNEQLRTLDDRFDEMEKLYEDDSDSSWGGHSSDEDDENNPAAHAPLRGDLDQIMDDFLSRFEVLGGKMRPVLEGTPGMDPTFGKLDRIRRELASLELGQEEDGEEAEVTSRRREKERILEIVERQIREEEERGKRREGRMEDVDDDIGEKERNDKWDCETVLSTYSNLSNHPRLLRLRSERGPRPMRIRIDEKTGFPVVEGEEEGPRKPRRTRKRDEMIVEEEEDEEEEEVRETIVRPKNETPAERKARKTAIKEERAARRTVKKTTKEAFGNETKRQKKIAGRAVEGGRAADVRVGDGVRRLA